MADMYVASFCFDSDGDFYYDDYKNLNNKTYIYESAEEALLEIRRHFEIAVESAGTHQAYNRSYVKKFQNAMRQILNTPGKWMLRPDGFWDICLDYSNVSIRYSIGPVEFAKRGIA